MIKNTTHDLHRYAATVKAPIEANGGFFRKALRDTMVVIPVLLVAILFIPRVRTLLDSEMYLKMLVQVPGLTILSFIVGLRMDKFRNAETGFLNMLARNGSTALVFLFGAQTFWMLPRSLDLSVYNKIAEIFLFLNLVVAGFAFGAGFKTAPFVLKTAFSIYGLAMALTMGIVYIHFNSLICAVYTIEMQHTAGRYTLYVFPFVFALFLYRLFYSMARLGPGAH